MNQLIQLQAQIQSDEQNCKKKKYKLFSQNCLLGDEAKKMNRRQSKKVKEREREKKKRELN